MERLLGSAPTIIDSPPGPHVHWAGGGEPKVLLLGHHDTVFPLGSLAARPFAVSDGRATGPGVFDMLGGIVQALHGLAALDDLVGRGDPDQRRRGGRARSHSRALIEERAMACGAVLVLEPSADGGLLKTGRKGVGTFDVTVHGRAAHAGLEPEKGVNALIEAARQVLTISEFGRADVGHDGHADRGDRRHRRQRRARRGADQGRRARRVGRRTRAGRVGDGVAASRSIRRRRSRSPVAIGRPPMPESASVDADADRRNS